MTRARRAEVEKLLLESDWERFWDLIEGALADPTEDGEG